MVLIYLDLNVVDDIGKGALKLRDPDSTFAYVYSDEHFNEIKRAEDTRFLEVLRCLRAQKLELQLDSEFRITSSALLRQEDPVHLYEAWLRATGEVQFEPTGFSLSILSRMFGADNDEALESLPETFERELTQHFQSVGLWDTTYREQVSKARKDMESIIGYLAERPVLEKQREAFHTHGGRGSNLLREHDNPLQALADIIDTTWPGVTADRLLGFDPPDKAHYEEWPMYLGIAGCYTMLNMVGLRPDKKLSDEERMPAILSDASHAGFAAYCHALISADQRFCDKTRAIYKYKNIATVVGTLR